METSAGSRPPPLAQLPLQASCQQRPKQDPGSAALLNETSACCPLAFSPHPPHPPDLTLRYNIDSYMSKQSLPKLRQFRWAGPLASRQRGAHLHTTNVSARHQPLSP